MCCVWWTDVLREPAVVVSDRSSHLFVWNETRLHGVWLPRSRVLNTARQSLRHEILQAGLSCHLLLSATFTPYTGPDTSWIHLYHVDGIQVASRRLNYPIGGRQNDHPSYMFPEETTAVGIPCVHAVSLLHFDKNWLQQYNTPFFSLQPNKEEDRRC